MRKGLWFGVLAALTLASVLWGRPGVVHLTDGSQLSGDVDDSAADKVVITIHGVQEVLSRSSVASIEYFSSIDEAFVTRLAKLGPNDVNGRIDLAKWAGSVERYDLARSAAAEALAIDPTNPQAKDLLITYTYEAGLSRNAGSEPSSRPAEVQATGESAPVTQPSDRFYLTLEQVNEIRQSELKQDEGFRVSFPHDVRKRFLARGEIDATSFYSMSPGDQARRILQTGDANLARDVSIDSDPAAMAEFRRRVGPVIIGGCAAVGCHNSVTAAGGFGLFTHDDSPRALYTNFYMLQTYQKPPIVPGGPAIAMIDRIHPEQSLLAEYGLPQAIAAPPHPAVDKFHPAFPSRGDPRYESMIHWMGFLLRPEGGRYADIQYQPPWAAQPATRPAG
jgi:hypothetical protein